MLSCSFGTADSHKSSSCLHGHQHELCKHEEFLNWILLVIELCHLPNGARDTDFWVATRGAHLLMPVTRPLLNFATSCCGEIFSSWASEQLPRQRRALILTSRAKHFLFWSNAQYCAVVTYTHRVRRLRLLSSSIPQSVFRRYLALPRNLKIKNRMCSNPDLKV